MSAKGYRVWGRGDKNVSEVIMGLVELLCEYSKQHRVVYTLYG